MINLLREKFFMTICDDTILFTGLYTAVDKCFSKLPKA